MNDESLIRVEKNMVGEIYIASNFDYATDIYQLRYRL